MEKQESEIKFLYFQQVYVSDTTRIIASINRRSRNFNNQNGCSQVAGDQQLTMDVMAGMAANPNVYGIVVVSLGCEKLSNGFSCRRHKKKN